MNPQKGLVLDSNILIRAVLGKRVLSVLERGEGIASFYSPDICFEEAAKYVPGIFAKRGRGPEIGRNPLALLAGLVDPVDRSLYREFETLARQRISSRDVNDWPVVATALRLGLPIWTEDRDFFGSGIATWTTDRVELYFDDQPHRGAAS